MNTASVAEVYHLYAGPQPPHNCYPLLLADCACCGLTFTLCVQVTTADIENMVARRWRCDVCLEDCKGRPPL